MSLLFKKFGLFSIALAIIFQTFQSGAQEIDEPIGGIGHGGFFDQSGKQIMPTQEFIAKAQRWYQAKLLANVSAAKKAEFAGLQSKLNQNVRTTGQSQLVVNHRLLEWLLSNSKNMEDYYTILGKLNAVKFALQSKLPTDDELQNFKPGLPFKLDSETEKKLKIFEPSLGPIKLLSITTNSGQAYIDECRTAGVPIPPPIGQMDATGLAGWKSQGFIPTAAQFIVNTPAEVRTFESISPPGMCMALPRYSDASLSTVSLDGVICIGQTTSKVCFWDNQMARVTFSFSSGTRIPIGVPNTAINPAGQYQAGGLELEGGAGGKCTNCHAGQNPYIIHPLANLGSGNLMALNNPPESLPTFSATRYDPLVPASWWQNQLSHATPLVPAQCSGCHVAGGSGGAFPHLSTDLNGPADYCPTVLRQAIERTMPPSAPGSLRTNPAIIAFQDYCGTPTTAGPSNRGDPHLTTTNGISYDFQAAGEFVALRNSSSKFELQTRQTSVATVATPVADAYTDLASCVSLNTAAAFRLGKYRVSYQPQKDNLTSPEGLVLRVDGKVANFATPINLGSGNVIARNAAGGLNVNASDGTRLVITPNFWDSQGYWYLDIEVLNTPAREGIMGHIGRSNWLPYAPDGSSFGTKPGAVIDRHTLLYKKFADAWRVSKTTSLFDYATGTSTANFTDTNWPPLPGQRCVPVGNTRPLAKPMEINQARQLCGPVKAKDARAFEECVFDLSVLGNTKIPAAYLRSLQLRKDASLRIISR